MEEIEPQPLYVANRARDCAGPLDAPRLALYGRAPSSVARFAGMSWYEAIKDAWGVAEKLKDADLSEKLANVKMEGQSSPRKMLVFGRSGTSSAKGSPYAMP